MSSRIRDNPINLFDVFLEIAAPSGTKLPWILWKYPEDYDNTKLLKSVVEFAFPCDMTSEAVQLFSFVFTDADSKYSFLFCRHTPRSNTCLCVLSYLPWFEVFYKLLNHVADIMNNKSPQDLDAILTNAYHQTVPKAGETLTIETSWGKNKLEVICPDTAKLPRIPDSRNLTEYYNAVDEHNMIAVFASMIRERRIIFVSRRISQLSSCVIAANMLIYPMHWQHIFITVLPAHLHDYLHAPMPFLIGVDATSMEKASRDVDLSECVILDIDTKEFKSPFNDFAELPYEVQSILKKNLKTCNHLLGDGLARSFLRALVAFIGNYRAGFHFRPGEPITFDFETYVKSRPPSMQPYMVEKMSQMQIFRQFIQERLEILNSGSGLKDEFEEESALYSGDKELGQFKMQYETWKREGKDIYKTFKKKVRDKGKEALSDFKGKMSSLKDEKPPSPMGSLRSPKGHMKAMRPSSVPGNLAKKFISSNMVVRKPDLKIFETLSFDPFRYGSNEEMRSDGAEMGQESREEMSDILNKRSSVEEELEALQKTMESPALLDSVGSLKSSGPLRQSVSCDDLLQINGTTTIATEPKDFRDELNEIFARSVIMGSGKPTNSTAVPQAALPTPLSNGLTDLRSNNELFARPNSSSPARVKSPQTFPQIRTTVTSSHSASDFGRVNSTAGGRSAPPISTRFPQLQAGSGQSSLSSLDSFSLRSLTAPQGGTLLIDLQDSKGPKNLDDVIFDPLLDPRRNQGAKMNSPVTNLPVKLPISPPLPMKPSREMPVIKPLSGSTNSQTNLVAAGQQPGSSRNGWEKFE